MRLYTASARHRCEGDKFPAITFADLEKTQVGDLVLAIGNPFGVGQSVTIGIISAKGRGGMGMIDYEYFIQTDASINPGNPAARSWISRADWLASIPRS